MTQILIFTAIHAAALILWAIDSRSFQHLRARNKYMRAFKKHEKAHKITMELMDQELRELISKEKLEYRGKAIRQHPSTSGPRLAGESLDIMNRLSKENLRPAKSNIIWPEWHRYRDGYK
jgi:Tfp pilus assembly ATPase PilU